MKLLLCGRTQMMDQFPAHTALAKMAAMGLDGAEVCVEGLDFSIRPELFDRSYLVDVAAAAKQAGLKAWSYSYHADYIRNDDVLDRTLEAIRLTPALETDIFVFSGGRSDKLADPVAEWDALVERTGLLAVEAEKNGVRLALETEPGFICGTTAELLRLMDEVESDSLYCNMDIGHAFLCDPDPLQALQNLSNRIIHYHFEDMKRGVHDHRLPGDGDMDLSMYVDQIRKSGKDCPVALDLYGYDYETVLPKAIKYIRNI